MTQYLELVITVPDIRAVDTKGQTDRTLIDYSKADTIMFQMFKNQISLILIITLAIIKVNLNKLTHK